MHQKIHTSVWILRFSRSSYFFEALLIAFVSLDFFRAAVFFAITPTLAALSSAFWTVGKYFLASSRLPAFESSPSFFTASRKDVFALMFCAFLFPEARMYFLADCLIGTFVSLKCKVQN